MKITFIIALFQTPKALANPTLIPQMQQEGRKGETSSQYKRLRLSSSFKVYPSLPCEGFLTSDKTNKSQCDRAR